MTTSIKTARIPMPNTQTSNPSNQKKRLNSIFNYYTIVCIFIQTELKII